MLEKTASARMIMIGIGIFGSVVLSGCLPPPGAAPGQGTAAQPLPPPPPDATATNNDLSSSASTVGARTGRRPPPPFAWTGTANDGTQTYAARMFLRPPRKPRGVDGASSHSSSRRPPPPGIFHIGSDKYFLKPGKVEFYDSMSSDRPRPIKSLDCELVEFAPPPKDGDTSAVEPKIVGSLHIDIKKDTSSKKGILTGTATITKDGETKTYTLSATLPPPEQAGTSTIPLLPPPPDASN